MRGTRWAIGLRLFGGFCCVIALALAVSALIDAHERANQLTTWPAAVATIQSCGIDEHRPMSSRGRSGGIIYAVRCKVAYTANGAPVVGWAKSTPRSSGRTGTNFTFSSSGVTVTNPAALFDGWMAHHRRGSQLTIRYNPATPDRPSFLGTDPVLDVDPVPQTETGVLAFAALGLIAWTVGRLALAGLEGKNSTARSG
jgi:hypothetical protein